jgi:ABC-type oligopeptide transport system ATPase subunit
VLRLEGVWKGFERGREWVSVLEDVSLEVRAGRVAAVVGGHGQGKSTLIRLATGMLRPDRGGVSIDGRDLGGLSGRDLEGLLGTEIGVAGRDGEDRLNVRDYVEMSLAATRSYSARERAGLVRDVLVELEIAGCAGSNDTANSLADPGITYETFGNTIKLPAADAGGKEPSGSLSSEYYVDGQVYKQEQGEQKLEYKLDPEERTLETISTGKPVDSTVTSHYDAAGGAVAWTGEGSGETEKWTRNIPGIDGTLTATQRGGRKNRWRGRTAAA